MKGFRDSSVPKIEVYRQSRGKQPMRPGNATIVSVATDEPIVCDRLILDLNDAEVIARHVVTSASAVRPRSPSQFRGVDVVNPRGSVC